MMPPLSWVSIRDNVALDQVLESMDYLIGYIKTKQGDHTADTNISASLFSMLFGFDKFYKITDQTPAYAGARFLNPTFGNNILRISGRLWEEVHPGTMN